LPKLHPLLFYLPCWKSFLVHHSVAIYQISLHQKDRA
jgi:hypothetical protein